MRLIDADALKEYIGGVRAEYNFFDDDERPRYEAHSKAIYLLDLYLDNAPTIDAVPIEHINLMNLVEVVRCKECKYWEKLNYEAPKEGWCDDQMPYSDGRWVDADDFCSYGEREGK